MFKKKQEGRRSLFRVREGPDLNAGNGEVLGGRERLVVKGLGALRMSIEQIAVEPEAMVAFGAAEADALSVAAYKEVVFAGPFENLVIDTRVNESKKMK